MRALLFILLIPTILFAQNKPGTLLGIKKAEGTITLDGILDEPEWQTADVAKDWYLNYPIDSVLAPFQTEARLTFNEHFLYVSFVCYDDESRDMINSLRRDFDYERNDNVGINIGPYNDKLNGFFFVLTPKGIQMEGTMSGGGSGDDSYSIYWDNKWYSKVVRYKDKWVAEAAIPFKSFRYKSGIKEWNIAFDRLDKKRNQKSSWIRTPIQFPTGAFAYAGQLVWEDPIPPPHTNISLIPFVAGNASYDKDVTPKNDAGAQVGLDAKVAVTPSMNLDLTLNPDFSQVEVDQQVINLTRFEFQFPERRQFFLENSDLFGLAGFPEARTFFSRRIGLAKDSTGLYKRVPIAYGARLSGSINKRWRLSVMNLQTKQKLEYGLPSQNYSVATIQHNFWKQSSASITYVDKESLGVREGDQNKYFHEGIFQEKMINGASVLKPNTFNRVLSADADLLSADNKWYSSSFLSRSFDAFNTDQNVSGGTFLQYSLRNISLLGGSSFVGKNFNSEAGFVPSHGVYPGQINYFTGGQYKHYPKNSSIVFMGPKYQLNHTYLPSGILSDKNYSVGYEIRFLNTTIFQANYNYTFQRMTSTFNPINSETYINFNPGEKYAWHNVTLLLQTNSRRLINFTGTSTLGGFYNGTNYNLTGQLNYRYQPYGNISMRIDYNDVRLYGNYGKEKLFLIGPRIDITFSDKIFLTSYVQYNNLLDNMLVNARFQWRYKPASDFFIVYTGSYSSSDLSNKNWALVLKLTRWINI